MVNKLQYKKHVTEGNFFAFLCQIHLNKISYKFLRILHLCKLMQFVNIQLLLFISNLPESVQIHINLQIYIFSYFIFINFYSFVYSHVRLHL